MKNIADEAVGVATSRAFKKRARKSLAEFSKAGAKKYQKRLTDHEIIRELSETSIDEDDDNQQKDCYRVKVVPMYPARDNLRVTVIRIISDKCNLKKMEKRTATDSKVDSTPNERPSRQRKSINYNEDRMFKKLEQKIGNADNNNAKTRRKTNISSNSEGNKENWRTSDNGSEVDGNSIPNSMKTPSTTRTPITTRSTRANNLDNVNPNIRETPRRANLKSKELTKKSFDPKYNECDKKRNLRVSSFEESESGDDDNDGDFESESESESDDTSISSGEDESEEDYRQKRKKNKNKKITLTPKTPSMHSRTINIMKPSTPLQEARLKLHVSILPKSLPCREEQFNDIYTFLHTRLSDKSGGCIYVSGVPGTGKTATVSEVIRCLKKSRDAGKLTQFEFVDINGMKLSEPRQAYVQIWKQLTNEKVTWEQAQKKLQTRFSKSNSHRGMTLLLVDELDLLCTRRQDVIYNLLDWPTKRSAKLVVVTIANTMDLPERVLMSKVTSRLGLSRLTFPPYNYKQLEEIVASRLRGYNAFGGEAIELVARKVAAVSGDARRALDICRRATEIAENRDEEIVSMMDIKQAVDEMIASPKIQAIKHCSEMERLFLQAVCAEVHRTGIEEVVFKNVYIQLAPLCTVNGESTPNESETLGICARLGAWRLLLCEHSRMDIHQKILLNVSTDDVHFATRAIED